VDGTIAVGWALAGILVLLAVAAALVVWLGGIGHWRQVATAALRAAGQLALVSLVITAVLRSGWLTTAFVLLMFGIATLTSARRVSTLRRGGWVAVAIGAGVAPVLALLLGSGLVPASPLAVVPVAGILIGGAMTATTLAGRRALDELAARRGEYEAALALGLSTRESALLVARPTAGQALVPALDQTRTVGLVTLPGTFVGVLLGGADPIQAGATQLVVLVALLAIEAVAVVVVVELVAAGRVSRGGLTSGT
jgi:UDP-glucose/iron transport system permease protein